MGVPRAYIKEGAGVGGVSGLGEVLDPLAHGGVTRGIGGQPLRTTSRRDPNGWGGPGGDWGGVHLDGDS